MRRNWIGVSSARQGAVLSAFGVGALGCQLDAFEPSSRGLPTTANAAKVAELVTTTIIPATTSTVQGTVWGRAWALNEAGVVAGHRYVIGGATIPSGTNVFLWKDGEFTLYPTNIFPVAINRRLEMAGNSNVALQAFDQFTSVPPANRALYWRDGVVSDLGTLGGSGSVATNMNEKGQIVGMSRTAAGVIHAFIWADGEMSDLGTLGGATSAAYGINNRGQVVGWSLTANGETHGFLWENAVMTDLGVVDGTFSAAYAINDHGEIAGLGRSAGVCGSTLGSTPIIWRKGIATAISLAPATGCFATLHIRDFSDAGHVLGTFTISSTRGWVWRDGVAIVLPGTSESTAYRINDSGEAAGFGGQSVGFGPVTLWSVGRHGPWPTSP